MLGRLALCGALVALSQQTEPPAGPLITVQYPGPEGRAPATHLPDPTVVKRDLERIRRAGFNGITAWLRWADAEPRPGVLRLAPAEGLIAAAAEHDLQVVLRILTFPAPAWAAEDGAAAERFIRIVRGRVDRMPGLRALQVAPDGDGDPPSIRVGSGAASLAQARLAFWEAIARRQSEIVFAAASGGFGNELLPLGETAGVVTRNEALFAPLRPRSAGVREMSGAGGGPVDVRLLESPQALMIIAVNRAASPRTARIQFEPDIPEAIWQNLETGAAVNFVMGKTGPFLEHSFAASDALVLMIRKTLR